MEILFLYLGAVILSQGILTLLKQTVYLTNPYWPRWVQVFIYLTYLVIASIIGSQIGRMIIYYIHLIFY